MKYIARVMQREETGEEQCLREFCGSDYDDTEDRAAEWINDRDLDNQYPESVFFIAMEREEHLWAYYSEEHNEEY